MSPFGKFLQEEGISNDAAAKKAGVSTRTVRRWVSGKTPVKAGIITLFGGDVESLMVKPK